MWYVCIAYNNVKMTLRFCLSLWRISYYVTITLFVSSMYLRFFKALELRYILVRSNYVWKGPDNYVLFLFIIEMYFLLRYNYVIYLFNVVTFFDDVGNRFYFDTFELRVEMTWQLRFVFVCHCDKVFIALQLRYLFVRCSYVFWWH